VYRNDFAAAVNEPSVATARKTVNRTVSIPMRLGHCSHANHSLVACSHRT
jgi:hypothetical protein